MMQILIVSVSILAAYFLGRYVKPIGELYAFVFSLARKLCDGLKAFLAGFQNKADSEKPGLTTIVRFLAFVVALLACAAEAYGGIDAASSLFGDPGGNVPFLPAGFSSLSLGTLFL